MLMLLYCTRLEDRATLDPSADAGGLTYRELCILHGSFLSTIRLSQKSDKPKPT